MIRGGYCLPRVVFRLPVKHMRRAYHDPTVGRKRKMKPQGSAAAQVTAPPQGPARVHGSTIISVPHQHVMTDLCLDERDTAPSRASTQKMFKVRLANNEGYRISASFLVQQRYAWRGYDVGVVRSFRPNRITFSAFDHDEVIATISVGLDSALGLFVDTLYGAEVDQIRAQKRKVCEFTKLAIDGSVRSKTVLAALFHIAYIYARRINRCTDLLVEVNPRHVLFYRLMLGFSDWGPERMDPRVRAPAVLLRLRLAYAERQIAKLGGRVELGRKMRSLYPYFFSEAEETGIEKRLRELG